MSTSTLPAQATFTPEDLLRLPDGDQYELVDGRIVEANVSFLSSYVAGNIFSLIDNHSRPRRLGWLLPESGLTFQCFPHDPNLVRKADVAFIRLDRLSVEQAMTPGHTRIAPDLAVEVVSPNDVVYELHDKVNDYILAGVPLIWGVNPRARFVEVFRASGQGVILRDRDDIDGEDVVPGFRCRVAEFFAVPGSNGMGN